MKDLEILKRLLAEAEEEETKVDAEASDEETVEEPKPGSFEADPIAFILKKYHGLNELMTELMTKDFQEYVDGIFIMAPKPTTFKIQLHNGQFFFLVYLGKAYEATIEGKKYYLMGIGEKERCMTAIARLLRFGTPLKTQGPEGAEQATREEDNTGMEGDWAAQGGATGGMAPEAGAEETPPEESGTEELAETRRILEAILMREAKEDPKFFLKHIMSALKDIGENPSGIDSKNGGPHTRASLGDETESVKKITDALIDTGMDKSEFKIDAVSPNDHENESRSGKFYTYIVTAKKDVELEDGNVIKRGSKAHVVSNVVTGKSTIAGKALTPTTLGVSDETFKNGSAIVETVSAKTNQFKDKNLSTALNLLMKDVANQSKATYDNVSEIIDYTKNINLSDDTQKALKNVLPADLDTIGKDFGEILGAILMGNEINLEKGVYFPGGNEPLIDFYVDGYGISSKYKGGAAATLTKVVEQLKPEQLVTANQKKLHSFLSSAFENSPVSESYLYMAKQLKNPALIELGKLMKIDPKSITIPSMSDFILQTVGTAPKKEDSNADKKIQSALGTFFAEAGGKPKFPLNWGKLKNNNKIYGIIMSPLSYSVAKQMNNDATFSKGLKEMISKAEIKQLYLDFNLGKNTAAFKLKSFADPNASFSFTPSNISTNNPDNGNMGFKMK